MPGRSRCEATSASRPGSGKWRRPKALGPRPGRNACRRLTLGADYYALSQQPDLQVTLPRPADRRAQSFINQNSGGAHGIVTQPLYTSGRISSGIAAAESQVSANRDDLRRTVLDVKMNVAEYYVAVLSATKFLQVAQSKVSSLTAHLRDVSSLYEKGLVSKNDLLAAEVALADARQKALDTANKLEVAQAAYNRALGRVLTGNVQLAELQDDGARWDVNDLTARAMQQRPELAALAAQAQCLATASRKRAGQDRPPGRRARRLSLSAGSLPGTQRPGGRDGRRGVECPRHGPRSQPCQRLERQGRGRDPSASRHPIADRLGGPSALARTGNGPPAVIVARQTTAQADENLRVARDRYQHQVGTNTEVLDAETLRIQAYTNLYDSTYQAVLAGLRLRRAVGSL